MGRQPIIKATVFVALFWWTAFTVYQAGFDLRGLIFEGQGLDIGWLRFVLIATGAGILCGVFSVAHGIWFDRNTRAAKLLGRHQYGLASTIGVVPLHFYDLREEGDEPTTIPVEDIAAVPEIEKDGSIRFLEKWHAKYDKPFPFHSALMTGIESILVKHRNLPATHVAGGHGGRSLLAHSILVSWYMDKEATHHKYDGKIKLPGFTIALPLKRANYEFEPDDPLIALIGLAHDLGKIECYEFNDAGDLVGCRQDHDSTGARVLARMSEFWQLPADDREILNTVIGFYHHPQDVPTEDGYAVRDDRLHAVLELLIKADTLASKREAGESARDAQLAVAVSDEKVNEVVETKKKEVLWDAVREVLLREDVINGPKGAASNLGFKRWNPLLKQELLYLVESDFVAAICALTGLENTIQKTTNPVGPVTRALLKLFEEKGCLYAEQSTGGRNAESALYKVEFFTDQAFWADRVKKIPNSVEKRGAATFTLGSCIIIQCEPLFPELLPLLPSKLMPVIGASRLGNRGKRIQKTALEDAIIESELNGQDSEEGVEVESAFEKALAKQAEKSKAPAEDTKPSDLPETSLTSPAPMPGSTQAPVQNKPPATKAADTAAAVAKLKTRILLISAIVSPGERIVPLSKPDASGKRVDSKGNYVLKVEDVQAWLTQTQGEARCDEIMQQIQAGDATKCKMLGNFIFVASD